jgi:MerR family transcriptional regulator, copper efflux regulator
VTPNGLFIGAVATRSGASRKALRLYEAAGILPKPRRTPTGYRAYDQAALGLVAFVRQAQRLGFTLEDIKEIVSIKRSGRAPCPRVRDLVSRKATELDKTLADLRVVRHSLQVLLRRSPSRRTSKALVCPHIEYVNGRNRRKKP